jgi:hypothetical protein
MYRYYLHYCLSKHRNVAVQMIDPESSHRFLLVCARQKIKLKASVGSDFLLVIYLYLLLTN